MDWKPEPHDGWFWWLAVALLAAVAALMFLGPVLLQRLAV